jgi:DNA-binding GntR family transcriptional regulator
VTDFDRFTEGIDRSFKGRAQLGDEVASYLRDLIMSGRLSGGEYVRLDRLASHLGVSATPVREALMSLRAEGFVELEPRKGFSVKPLSEKDVRDVFDAQAALAGELASRATGAMDDAMISKLRVIQKRLVVASDREDLEAIELENYLFHREINLLAASPKLAWLLGMAVHYSPRRFYSTIEGWPKASIEDHEGILEALENRDAAGAMEAMSMHIMHAGNLLAQFLGSQSKRADSNTAFDDQSAESPTLRHAHLP